MLVKTSKVTRVSDLENNENIKKDEENINRFNTIEVNKSINNEINVKKEHNFVKNEKFKENDEDFDAKIDLKRSMEIKIECNNEKNNLSKSKEKIQNLSKMSESSDFCENSKNINNSKNKESKKNNNKLISNIKISKQVVIEDQNGRNKNEFDKIESKGNTQIKKLSLKSQISLNSNNLILKNENDRLFNKCKEKVEKAYNYDIPFDNNNESNKSFDSEHPNNENPIPIIKFSKMENLKLNNDSLENLKNGLKNENENKINLINKDQIVDKINLKNISRNNINQDVDLSSNRNRSSSKNETWRKIKISNFIPDEKLIDIDDSISNIKIDDLIFHSELYNVTFPEVNKYQKPFSLKFCALTKNNFRYK